MLQQQKEPEIYLARSANQFVKPVRWIASLSNGETIFEDHKPGENSAWERLSKYVKANSLSITRLRFQMNSLEVPLPAKSFAYIQKKKFISTGGHSQLQYCIGHVENNGKALVHYVSEDCSSYSEIINDPGAPFTIYDHTKECDRSCCNAITNTE